MKTITVQWKISPKREAQLRKVAKSWGYRTIAQYIKQMFKAKVGSVEHD